MLHFGLLKLRSVPQTNYKSPRCGMRKMAENNTNTLTFFLPRPLQAPVLTFWTLPFKIVQSSNVNQEKPDITVLCGKMNFGRHPTFSYSYYGPATHTLDTLASVSIRIQM